MNTSSVVYDFKGVAFESTSEMCKHYNISWTTYMSRRHNGWSVQKALLTPVKRARGIFILQENGINREKSYVRNIGYPLAQCNIV